MKETTRNVHRHKRAAGNRQRPTVNALLRLVFICCGGCSAEPTVAPVCAKTGSRLLYACTDNLGSITRLVDGQGSVVFSVSYDAWGNQTIITDSIGFLRCCGCSVDLQSTEE